MLFPRFFRLESKRDDQDIDEDRATRKILRVKVVLQLPATDQATEIGRCANRDGVRKFFLNR